MLAVLALFFALSSVKSFGQCNASFVAVANPSGSSVQFYDSSYSATGNPVAWFWDFGDGTFDSTQFPVHQFNIPVSQVCLTVQFSNGCSSTYCDSIVTRSCSAYFSASNAALNATFTDQSTAGDPISTYTWDFGDGSPASTQANATHTYSSYGNYLVCLTITTTGGCSDTYCQTISLSNSGTCGAGFSASGNSSNNTVNFTDTSWVNPGTITSYFWDFGDSSGTSAQANPTYTYPSAGVYYACLTITTSTGCISTQCQQVIAGNFSSCQAAFSYYLDPATGLLTFYDGSQVFPGTVSSVVWDFGDSTSGTGSTITHSYSQAGSYNVCMTITSTTGCTSTDCNTIVVNNTSSCNALFYSQVSGTTVNFAAAAPNPALSYSWDFGDGQTSTAQGLTITSHQYPSNGVYRICLIVFDTTCTDIYCDSVVIGGGSSVCSAAFTFIPDSTGMNSYYFIDLSTPATSYLWDFGDGNTSTLQNPVHYYNLPGTYNVCLTIADSNSGCTDTFCRLVNDSLACQPVFTVLPDSTNPTGVPMNFAAYSICGTPSAVFWDFGDGSTDTTSSGTATHVYATAGTYTVCVCEVIGVDTFCYCDTITAYRLANGISENNLEYLNLTAYPNPFSSALTVSYDLEHTANVQIEIYSITGNRVLLSNEGRQTSGHYNTQLNGESLADGLYLLKISIDHSSITKKVSLQR